MVHPHPTPESSGQEPRTHTHPLPVPIQHTASMSPPPPYVPLPPASPGPTINAESQSFHLPPQQPVYSQRDFTVYSPAGVPSPYAQHVAHVPQQVFGPTPLSTTLPLLPYAFYESPAIADGRARWRFLSAMVVALGVYFFVGIAVGLEVLGEVAGWKDN